MITPAVASASSRDAHGVIELFHLLVTLCDTGVEEHEPIRVVDQVAADHDLSSPR